MAVSGEALDIILRLQGVPTYVAGMREGAAANREFAASQKAAAEASTASAASNEKAAGAAALMSKGSKAGVLLVAAALVEGYKASVNFNKQMEMIATQAHGTQKEVDSLSKSVLAFAESGRTKFTPVQLAEGLYHLESIGLRGPAAMKALEIASNGAAVGAANLEHTTTALGAAWIVGAKGAGNLHNVMGILNATVGAGNMRMEQLVQALGSGIIPISKVAHLSIQDIGAAVATLTDSGFTASSGMAQLGTALHFLYDPSTKAKKALESIGLTQRQLFEEMSGPKGLHGALELLHSHLLNVGGGAEQAEKLGEILPGGRGKVMITLLEELERFEQKKKQIIAQAPEFDDKVTKTMETPAFKISAAWSKFMAVLTELGDAFSGPFTTVIAGVLGILGELMTLILHNTNHGKDLVPVVFSLVGAYALWKAVMIASAIATWAQDAALTVAIVALYALDGAMAVATGAAWLFNAAMDADPIVLIAIAVALLIFGLVMLIKHWKEVANFLRGPWGTAVLGAITLLAPWIGIPLTIAVHWKELMHVMKDVVNWIKGAWKDLGKILASPFEWVWKRAKEAFKWIEDHAKHLPGSLTSSIPLIGGPLSAAGHFLGLPGYAEGGYQPFGGFASINERGPGETVWLPGGSTVTPSPANSMLEARPHTPSPSPNSQPTQLFVDAYLQMPRGISSSLFKLVTQEAVVREARS